jgi:hypothetical protein
LFPALRGQNFEYLAFVIHSAPEIVRSTVDPDEHFVQVPSPVRLRLMMNAPVLHPRGEHRTEPVPPETHGLVTDIDATLEQQIFDLPQRERITDLHHHREADHLRRTVEITEGIAHRRRLRNVPPRLKLICSDNAHNVC